MPTFKKPTVVFLFLTCLLLFLNSRCKKDQVSSNIVININPAISYQEMDGFGASDAWSCKYIGANWPDEKKEQIAELLFSRDTTSDGNPKGIGLSIWRFNIGAGSLEQGDNSYIGDPWRREECFLLSDGSYDWTKQAGQQWLLKAAKKRGTEKIVLFSNSPPVHYTNNGKAFSSSGSQLNIKAGYFDDFADFLVTVADHFTHEGINIDYISPVNEPQWDWSAGSNGKAGQEGSPATNSDVADLSKILSEKLSDKKLSTKIALSEAGKINYLYETTDADRGHQIEDYFSPESDNYVGNLSNVAHLICSHSYYSVYPVSDLITSRSEVKSKIALIDNTLKYWESEYCILENQNTDIKGGSGRDLSMKLALYVGRIIHYAITTGNASSWQWWTAISKYDYKDGLIHLDDGTNSGSSMPEYCKNNGYIRDSKLLWGLGNYSRFIRPGMIRVSAGSPEILANQSYGVFPSAFIDSQTGKLVVILINYTANAKNISINLKSGVLNGKLAAYVTSEDYNLSKTGLYSAGKIALPANSITTLVGKYEK